jgi:hypothetical protein
MECIFERMDEYLTVSKYGKTFILYKMWYSGMFRLHIMQTHHTNTTAKTSNFLEFSS